MVKRTCIQCGRIINSGSRCDLYGGDRRRMTTTQRGYGHRHQQRRAQLLPLAYGKPCAICGQRMTGDQKLDLDHTISVMHGGQGDRIVHAKCNRADRGVGRRRNPRRQRLTPLNLREKDSYTVSERGVTFCWVSSYPPPTGRRCTRCKEVLPFSAFRPNLRLRLEFLVSGMLCGADAAVACGASRTQPWPARRSRSTAVC